MFNWIFCNHHSLERTMPTIQEINSAIMFGNLTNDQLVSVMNAVKFARGQLIKRNRHSFTIGDTVKFTNSRTGRAEVGSVTKVMIKNVLVKTATAQWRVPANMLESA
jgi:hypothetical protein